MQIFENCILIVFHIRLKKHVSDPTNPPILIFPEGTCINNTSVMQFKKGSFEVGGVIYPVAIKVSANVAKVNATRKRNISALV